MVPIEIIFFELLYPFGSGVSPVLRLCSFTVSIGNHLAWLPHQVVWLLFGLCLGQCHGLQLAPSWAGMGSDVGEIGRQQGGVMRYNLTRLTAAQATSGATIGSSLRLVHLLPFWAGNRAKSGPILDHGLLHLPVCLASRCFQSSIFSA